MKLITAIIFSVTSITAQAGPVEDAFLKMGFNQTTKGVNKTVYASFEKNMDINTCNRFIANLASNLGRAPTNIVETPFMRVVRIGPTDFGSLLFTCNGSQIIANMSKNAG